MSRHLLQISIGPIQDFITAARRTRDLWNGSYLISEISKAVAKRVEENGGKLIFPSPLDPDDLKPDSVFNVANVILAEIADEETAQAVSASARKAALGRWLEFADKTHEVMKDVIDEDAWARQRDKDDVFEFYAAWYPLECDDDYKTARRDVARLLAARKNLRDFEPNFKPGETEAFGIPKSSLDGRRESVLRKDMPKNRQDMGGDINVKGVRIKAGESLDLIGCVKRAGGGSASFPSITTIALTPWIRGFRSKEDTCQLLDTLCAKCRILYDQKVLSKIDAKLRLYDAFPYEGQALLPQRYNEIKEGLSDSGANSPLSIVSAAMEEMKEIMRELSPHPLEPYAAVLVADGDKMGRAISQLVTPQKHREFSQSLSKFAGEAREIVRESFGSCVYTGGDDVLALVPLDTALDCARKLHDAFGALWKEGWKLTDMPSLSVGIAIGHALEDLEDLLNFGREAEKMAKKSSEGKADERDGLAITIRARGNSEISVREQWKAAYSYSPTQTPLADLSLDGRMLFWADRFTNYEIPSKFPYELRSAAKFYDGWGKGKTLDDAMKFDIKRIFRRKDLKLEKTELSDIERYIDTVIAGSYRSIERLADELAAAQWVGEARARAGGKFQ
ncbi:MAG: type III-B CRISPR-associated protein Cas10/Cmr2 [Synergistaceae bacterium]|jgi:CRISPR-associated protein Cmr2|nr:type III-B CRISPR-associated protein Cas10/Cmr2 [Synergistaceae bacterium]